MHRPAPQRGVDKQMGSTAPVTVQVWKLKNGKRSHEETFECISGVAQAVWMLRTRGVSLPPKFVPRACAAADGARRAVFECTGADGAPCQVVVTR